MRRTVHRKVVACLAAVAAAALAATSLPSGSALADGLQAPASGCPTVSSCPADLAAALDLEAKGADNFWYGLMLEIDYRTPDRTPGDVASMGAFGDSGLWTGTYLGAESMRYAVAKSHLNSTGEGPLFWQQQRDEAKARIDKMLAQMDLRTYIARDWTTQFQPTIDASSVPPDASFGGGVVQGEPGMLMRSCAPADAPPGRNMQLNQRVFGPFHWVNDRGVPARLTMPDGDYLCETAPSRDTYAGTIFGLLAAFDLVGPDDAAARHLIRDDILTMARFLYKNGWTYPRPHGNVSLPPFGHDFDNFISPLMNLQPESRLSMTQAAKHVADVDGSLTEKATWAAAWTEELASQGPILAASELVTDPRPSEVAYYGFNLAHLKVYNLIRLAANPAERALMRQAFSAVDRQTSDDVNAHFEAIAYSITGEPARLAAATTHLREWLDYRARIAQGGVTDNSSRCGHDIECVPEDQFDLITSTLTGQQSVTVAGTSSTPRAVKPLPIADRPPTDFLWQRSPFTDMNGSTSSTHQAPGIDYLLPYWMMRYEREVAPPTADPLTPWPGPSNSGL
jgi:hypothetical protein